MATITDENVKIEIDKTVEDPPPPLPPKPEATPALTQDVKADDNPDDNSSIFPWDNWQLYCGLCVLWICITTVGAVIVILFTNVVSIALIALGSYYVYDCPQNNFIPIALIGQGVIQIIQLILKYWGKKFPKKSKIDVNEASNEKSWPQRLLGYVSMGWFFSGAIQVYTMYEPSFDPLTAPNYCNKTLYRCAFWYYTTFYIFLIIVIICGCCYECYKRYKTQS